MIEEKFLQKSRYVLDNADESLAQNLLRTISESLGQSPAIAPLSLEALYLELAYHLTRYRHWISTCAFRDFMRAALQQNALMPHAQGEEILTELLANIVPLSNSSELIAKEHEFYEHLVATYSSHEQLSFSPSVWELIANGIARGDDKIPSQVVDSFEFCLEAPGYVDQAVARVKARLDRIPYALSVYKLATEIGQKQSYNFDLSLEVLECLVAIGCQGKWPVEDLRERIAEITDCPTEYLEALIAIDIIYYYKESTRRVVRLTKKGYALTKVAFGIGSRNKGFCPRLFRSIPATWQSSWISNVHSSLLPEFGRFIDSSSIVPRSVASAFCQRSRQLSVTP